VKKEVSSQLSANRRQLSAFRPDTFVLGFADYGALTAVVVFDSYGALTADS
jgi:hypothetical protein